MALADCDKPQPGREKPGAGHTEMMMAGSREMAGDESGWHKLRKMETSLLVL